MGAQDIDPSLIQDFLAESGELIEQLDGDLVTLESATEPAAAQELLNGIFRALHTIKGAASFLAFTNLTKFAHAAEDALNRLRKGDVRVTPAIMDALLKSVDVLREMLADLGGGQEIQPGPQDLIDRLHQIAESTASAAGQAEPAGAAASEPAAATPRAEEVAGEKPLKLPPQKADLVEFMVADLRDSTKQFEECLKQARNDATRQDASAHLAELADALVKTADFFDLADLTRLTKLLVAVAPKLAEAEGSILSEVAIRVRGIEKLINQQADALQRGKQLSWNLGTFIERFEALIAGRSLAADLTGKHQNDVDKLLALDGVTPGSAAAGALPAPPAAAVATTEEHEAEHDATAKTAAGPASEAAKKNLAEATVRVEVSRLEDLLNLVGQMVLTKNRLLALSRRLRDHHVPTEFAENVTQASSDLDRLTSELQVGVMRTRMQPLAKLFDRYPRVIRDIARMTGKKIDLEIQGKETEVDKSVLELLADPLVHILRNSADHGVEQPDVRAAGGKAEMGRVVLTAEHQGSHVRVAVTDDGKGLDREVLGRKAVEKGLTTVDQLSTMSDDQVFRFIFAPGFSTAEKISDLSGRGVGMDVVNTNVAKMNGSVNIFSGKRKGTTIEILIPLTVAIMPAMMVGVGKHLYAIPLQTVAEIVRPEASEIHSVRGAPVMRLRDSVLPLVDMRKRLRETGDEVSQRFAVVVGVGGQKAGLMVDRLVGQQEIVIKPLDDQYTKGGPFSGATIREDGDVSLILDVVQLIRTSQPAGAPAVRAAA